MSKAKLVAAQSVPMLPLPIATAGNKASFRFCAGAERYIRFS
jgi:hypothetical protein